MVSFEDLKLMLKSNLQANPRLGRSWEGTGRWEERSMGDTRVSQLGQSFSRVPAEAPHLSVLSLLSEVAPSEFLPCLGLFYSSPFLSFPLCLPAQHTGTERRGFPEKIKSFLQDLRTTHKPGT